MTRATLRHPLLAFALALFTLSTGLVAAGPARAQQKAARSRPSPVFPAQRMATGGPDGFGYRWIDSDEAGGPAYDFVDISGSGTALTLDDDDDQQVSFPSGFSFSFYGQTKSAVYVSSNGFLTFATEGADEYYNEEIPADYTPNDFIAPLWTDLDPEEAGTVYYEHDSANDRFIVQYEGVRDYDDTGNYTFQVILNADDSIVLQYETLTGELDDLTVGIENADGDDGLQIAYDQPYLKDGLAVRITTGVPYFTSTPATRVTAGAAYEYTATAADPDDDASALSITAPTRPSWLSFTDGGDGTATLSGTPTAADVGDHDVVLEATDADGHVATQGFTLRVAGPATLYVDRSATGGAGDGSSWADAYLYLQDALDQANGDSLIDPEIRVAEGTYYPDEDADGDHTPGDSTEAFTLTRDGVEWYGGYPAGGGTRDPAQHETILSGDLAQDDDAFAPDTDSDGNPDSPTQTDHLRGSNSLHVVHLRTSEGEDSFTDATVLDGFTITAGVARFDVNTGGSYRGGGLFCEVMDRPYDASSPFCSPALSHLHFRGNVASYGGAMSLLHSKATITDTDFMANASNLNYDGDYDVGHGGAVYTSQSDPTFTRVTFTDNIAPYQFPYGDHTYGGALESNNGDPSFHDVSFTGNVAANGGAVRISGSDYAVFDDVTFQENTAGRRGGALVMYPEGSGNRTYVGAPTLTDVTFTDNVATFAGAMYIRSSQTLDDAAATFTNVTFTDNFSYNHGGALSTNNFDGRLTGVTFENNNAGYRGGAVYSEGYNNATYVDAVFQDNHVTGEGVTRDGFLCGGAVFNASDVVVDSDYATSVPTFVNVLFSGNTAIDDPDGNDYESYGGAMCNTPYSNTSALRIDPVLVNVTFVGNQTGTGGGAIFNGGEPSFAYQEPGESGDVINAAFTNVIFWDNEVGGPYNVRGRQVLNASRTTLDISHSIIQESVDETGTVYSGIINEYQASTHYGAAILHTDPQFADDDLHLTDGSPALDAGALGVLDTDGDGTRDVTTDLAGAARVFGGSVDLGAYEFDTYRSQSDQPTVAGQVGFFKLGSTGATVLFAANASSNGGLSASRTDSDPSGPGLPADVLPGYWTITESLDGAFTYNATLDLAGTGGINDFDSLKVYKRSGPGDTWAAVDSLIHDAAAQTITAVGLTSFSEFAVGGTSAALPVELAAFEATPDGAGAVALTWQTASEANNDRFRVERQREGDAGWAKLGTRQTQAPGGTSAEALRYRFEDTRLPFEASALTYRLIQRDRDGHETTVGEKTVEIGAPTAFTLHGSFPNPMRSRTTIRYELPEKRRVTVAVYDVLGRKVRTLVDEEQTGRQEIPFEAGGLASGTYFYRITAGDYTETRKLVLVR